MDKLSSIINPDGLIHSGDMLYVVSDVLEYAKMLKQKGEKADLNPLIDCIVDVVGGEGTVLFPTYNWDFCKGIGFDYKKTPSKTGALTKAALKRDDFIRTQHPLYSFAVKGKRSEEFAGYINRNSFGEGTVFEQMYESHAKALVIGLPALAGLTFIHHIEKVVGVPYRYEKNFTADYTDASGHTDKRTYSMYVRDLDMNPIAIDKFLPMEEELKSLGIIKSWEYEGIPFHIVDMYAMFEPVKKDILENDSRKLYVYKGQLQ